MSNTASKLRLSGIIAESIVDGPGIRYAIFTQGCPHHCPGCHNPQTHDFAGGYEADLDAMLAEIKADPLLEGITLSGGEPFCQPEALIPLVQEVRKMGKTVFAYSGYTIEQLLELSKQRPAIGELLHLCDTLVDGPYVESLRDIDLLFRGSSNQRMIDLHEYFA
ncbi:MAG: anaerobic ribonucleoside-triphosphate reductase activating protein [Candidatus Merdivicinus sp.]